MFEPLIAEAYEQVKLGKIKPDQAKSGAEEIFKDAVSQVTALCQKGGTNPDFTFEQKNTFIQCTVAGGIGLSGVGTGSAKSVAKLRYDGRPLPGYTLGAACSSVH